MKIIYVGKKPSKNDTVAGTGLVWAPEQVHEVADDAAARLLKHPDVWADFDNWRNADGLALVNDEGQKTDLPSVDELRAALTAKGITFHHKAGAEKLAALLAEATKGE